MKVLIDTCVVMDVIQKREPFAEAAQGIFLTAANRMFDGFITAKASTDIYYLVHRFMHSDERCREVFSNLLTVFDLLDTKAADCKNAVCSNVADFEDAVMIETAIRSEIDCIVSRNIRDYKKSSVTVYQPADFLELFKLPEGVKSIF